jgi:hypothetical protein
LGFRPILGQLAKVLFLTKVLIGLLIYQKFTWSDFTFLDYIGGNITVFIKEVKIVTFYNKVVFA